MYSRSRAIVAWLRVNPGQIFISFAQSAVSGLESFDRECAQLSIDKMVFGPLLLGCVFLPLPFIVKSWQEDHSAKAVERLVAVIGLETDRGPVCTTIFLGYMYSYLLLLPDVKLDRAARPNL